MAHIPYGYRTEQGKAVVVEDQAAQIRKIYEGYLSGLGLTVAAAEAGLKMTHSEVKRILANRYYIGDDYYPAIDYWCNKDIRGLIQMPFSRHWIMHIEACLRIKKKIHT